MTVLRVRLLPATKLVCPFIPALAMTPPVNVKSRPACAISVLPSPVPVTYSPATLSTTVLVSLLPAHFELALLTVVVTTLMSRPALAMSLSVAITWPPTLLMSLPASMTICLPPSSLPWVALLVELLPYQP
ncbi:hypothetical protein D3C81_1339630 [compost metagenome]